MRALETVLALIGLVALIVVIARQLWYVPARPVEDDLATTYRQALEAAMRMQIAAQALQQEMYDQAIRQVEPPARPATIELPKPGIALLTKPSASQEDLHPLLREITHKRHGI